MKKFKLMLQMFNDEATSETQPVVEQPQAVEINEVGVEKWLETKEGSEYIKRKNDAFFTKGLQTHLEKNKDKYVSKEDYEALVAENQGKVEELSNVNKNIKIDSELKLKLLAEGAESEDIDLLMKDVDKTGISFDKEGNLIGVSETVTNFKIKRAKWFGKPPVNAAGRDTIAEGGQSPAAGSGKLTREQVNKLPSNERMLYKMKNPDWAK